MNKQRAAISPEGISGFTRVFFISFAGTWAWALPGLEAAAQGRPEVFGLQAAAAFTAAALGALVFPAFVGRLGTRRACKVGVAVAGIGVLLPLFAADLLSLAIAGAFVVSLGTWVVYLSLKGLLYRNLALPTLGPDFIRH